MSRRLVVGGVPWLVWPAARRPPLLLLHGFAGAPAAWEEVAGAVAGSFFVAAPWLPGHDAHPGWFGSGGFTEAVDALASALPSLAPPPWQVAGYSMGGRLALGLLVRHPGLVARAVLVGASAGLRGEAERRERRATDAGWCRLLREEGVAAFLDAWEAQPLFATQRRLPAARCEAQRRWRSALPAEGLARCLEALGLAAMPDLWPALSAIQVPVRLVVGEEDRKFVGLAEAMAAELPQGRVGVVRGAGHNVVLEAPEEVAAYLLGTGEEAARCKEERV